MDSGVLGVPSCDGVGGLIPDKFDLTCAAKSAALGPSAAGAWSRCVLIA